MSDLRAARRLATAVVAVGLATAVGLAAHGHVDLADLAMLYLVAIAAAAVAGRGSALVAAALAVAAFNYCFIPPRFTLQVADARHLITFVVMFGAGLTISTLMTRLRRREAEAREANLRARGEELRSALLSAVSHDLRTPLAVITGAATTLRDSRGELSPSVRRELEDTLVDEASRLERVLGNLLEMSRVETGLVPAREEVPVEELVGVALERAAVTLGSRPVTIAVPPDLTVSVDPLLFAQVLGNLLDNAVRHGAPPIEIVARRRGDQIELDVADHGPGVPAAARPHVFDRFFRASAAPGVGLGLAVVRGIVTAHGGAVELVPGAGGTCVRITLPAPPVSAPVALGPAAPAGHAQPAAALPGRAT